MDLLRKDVLMAVILVAALLDRAVGGVESGSLMFRTAAEFFYIASESLPVIENAGLLGIPVPKPLRQALEALREKNDREE